MKKIFSKPEMNIKKFKAENILTASAVGVDLGENVTPDGYQTDSVSFKLFKEDVKITW
ncbi:MAG: hypothetical protein Q4G33_11345 [bacterium]|nr:hypothetical protein [bacterium]